MRIAIAVVAAGLLVAGLFALPVQADLDWDAALQGEHRSEADQQRDKYRHPRQTLEFFGIRPGMTVVELSPGGGWYTDVLVPLVGKRGTLYAAHASLNPPNPYYRRSLGGFLSKIGGDDMYNKVIVMQFQPPKLADAAPAGSADMVVTFRNIHGWIRSDTTEDVMAAAYKALKSGGVFGVVQHRARPGISVKKMGESGYVTETYVISLAKSVGFKLADKSEINANPKDTADHPKGVWTLPPALRLGDERRRHYLSIGESDRMTLKFVKP